MKLKTFGDKIGRSHVIFIDHFCKPCKAYFDLI